VVETFLLNLLRGSGARGMRSIPAQRIPYVRPLIELKKNDILKYLKQRRLPYSVDETNRVLGHRRNLIRHTIVPELLKINPDLPETIKREIKIISHDDEYLEGRAAAAYKRTVKQQENHIFLDINRLARYTSAVAVRLVMNVIKELHGSLDGYESEHFQAVIGLMDKEGGKRINLPKGLYAQREYSTVTLGRTRRPHPKTFAVAIENEFLVTTDLILKTRVVASSDVKKTKRRESFDLKKIEPPLFLRTRRDGDYVQTKAGRKKMKKVFHEHKIPIHKRDRMLMLCDQHGILWIPGYVRAARGFINKKTKRILVVEFERTH
jgi:tRNA(Ile)-lysidine synthase